MEKTLAAQFRAKLAAVWEGTTDKQMDPPPQYASFVAQMFVEFVEFTEKMLRHVFGRIAMLEKQQAAILKEMKLEPLPADAPAPAPAAAAAPTNGNGNGHNVAPVEAAPERPADIRGMVRLNADNTVMTPEDQAMEEKADMALYNKIDESRYVPAEVAARLNQQAPQG